MKRSKKKLQVDKETVRPLTPDEAGQAEGGYYVVKRYNPPPEDPNCTYVATGCTDAGR